MEFIIESIRKSGRRKGYEMIKFDESEYIEFMAEIEKKFKSVNLPYDFAFYALAVLRDDVIKFMKSKISNPKKYNIAFKKWILNKLGDQK